MAMKILNEMDCSRARVNSTGLMTSRSLEKMTVTMTAKMIGKNSAMVMKILRMKQKKKLTN